MSSRPNLIFVFADQLRYQSLGYAGDDKAITPNFDAFAEQGMNFCNTVASAPVCTAYRAALMTGKYTTSNGMVINELRINPNQRCFGHVLTDGGYDTAYIGKWHLYANQLGHHYEPRNSHIPPGPHRLGFDGLWAAFNFHHESYGVYYHTDSEEKIPYGEDVYEPDAQTDMAIDFIRGRDGENPFALFLSWGPPHDPWNEENVPERFWEMFEDVPFPHPQNYRAENDPYGDGWSYLNSEQRDELEGWRRTYYAQTTSLDWNFGRLIEAIEEGGIADDTILVFTSDHGEMFGAQGRRAKNIFYEEACRVPFLIRWPGRIKAGVSDACLSTPDLFPTLTSLINLEYPKDVEGMDLSHLMLGERGPEPEAALMQICGATASWDDGHEWRALRDKRYTYAVYRADGRELLFDDQNDPLQLNDLAGHSDHKETLVRFRTMLGSRMAELNDTFECCTWYRDHWTDGDRRIIRSATCDWS